MWVLAANRCQTYWVLFQWGLSCAPELPRTTLTTMPVMHKHRVVYGISMCWYKWTNLSRRKLCHGAAPRIKRGACDGWVDLWRVVTRIECLISAALVLGFLQPPRAWNQKFVQLMIAPMTVAWLWVIGDYLIPLVVDECLFYFLKVFERLTFAFDLGSDLNCRVCCSGWKDVCECLIELMTWRRSVLTTMTAISWIGLNNWLDEFAWRIGLKDGRLFYGHKNCLPYLSVLDCPWAEGQPWITVLPASWFGAQ